MLCLCLSYVSMFPDLGLDWDPEYGLPVYLSLTRAICSSSHFSHFPMWSNDPPKPLHPCRRKNTESAGLGHMRKVPWRSGFVLFGFCPCSCLFSSSPFRRLGGGCDILRPRTSFHSKSSNITFSLSTPFLRLTPQIFGLPPFFVRSRILLHSYTLSLSTHLLASLVHGHRSCLRSMTPILTFLDFSCLLPGSFLLTVIYFVLYCTSSSNRGLPLFSRDRSSFKSQTPE